MTHHDTGPQVTQPASDWAAAALFRLLAKGLGEPLAGPQLIELAERLVGLAKEQSLLLARLIIEATHDRYPTRLTYGEVSEAWEAIDRIDPWVKEDRSWMEEAEHD